jgi:hypothetical protein
MKVYIVSHNGLIYSVHSTRAKAEAYITEMWVERVQPEVRIHEERVL